MSMSIAIVRPQPPTTVQTPANTDLSIFRCTLTNSYTVSANHWASDPSAKRSDCHNSRYFNRMTPVSQYSAAWLW